MPRENPRHLGKHGGKETKKQGTLISPKSVGRNRRTGTHKRGWGENKRGTIVNFRVKQTAADYGSILGERGGDLGQKERGKSSTGEALIRRDAP